MILSEDHNSAVYQIKSFSTNTIKINNNTYHRSLIISPNHLVTDWKPTSIATLTDEDLLLLLTCKPDIILLGTGERSIIPPAKKLATLFEKQFQCECMSTPSACRTYAVLSAEGRNVVAGLLLG